MHCLLTNNKTSSFYPDKGISGLFHTNNSEHGYTILHVFLRLRLDLTYNSTHPSRVFLQLTEIGDLAAEDGRQ